MKLSWVLGKALVFAIFYFRWLLIDFLSFSSTKFGYYLLPFVAVVLLFWRTCLFVDAGTELFLACLAALLAARWSELVIVVFCVRQA